MKHLKLAFFVVVLLTMFPFSAIAQNPHLKFMGISMGMSIDGFQQKLTEQGVKYNKVVSDLQTSRLRIFEGTFLNNDCNIYVYYTKKGSVYKCAAAYNADLMSYSENFYQYTKALLIKKYGTDYMYKHEDSGHERLDFYLNDTKTNTALGTINLYLSPLTVDGLTSYSVFVIYTDAQNNKINDDEQLDDL